MAAASYYLLVVNAPTPVVHERMVEGATSALNAVLDAFRAFLEASGGGADKLPSRYNE
jgi:hypothetical protein